MSSTVSSIFSSNNISDDAYQFNDDIDLNEILSCSSSSPKRTPLLTSALNTCYTKALLLLHKHLDELDIRTLTSTTKQLSSYNVHEDDFDQTVFPDRLLTPSPITIAQWRHEQFSNPKFSRLFLPLVSENIYSIVLHWIELELKNEEERASKNPKKKEEFKQQLYELKAMEKSIDIDRLYELSGNSKDILIEQVDWKSIGTKMRSKGGFKYFDEETLKRLWIHRCQYGLDNLWSDDEDRLLNELVEQFGYGKWQEIAQYDIFKKNKKSAFMCAQRYMAKANKTHAKRRFTQNEKDQLLSLYKYRCSVMKDYRFSVSHAAYILGDRGIREITHVWTYLNPDIQKKAFTPEEDAILLEYGKQNPTICWSTLASSYLPDRSAVQCRQRYFQLIKSQSTENTQSVKRKRNSRSKKYIEWFEKQPVLTKNFLEQFYSTTRMTQLQQSIIEMHSNKIELLMSKFLNNQNSTIKCLPLRDLILKLNIPTVTIDEIYAKYVNNT